MLFLQAAITKAKSRIVMASLYLGSGPLEQEIVRTMLYAPGERILDFAGRLFARPGKGWQASHSVTRSS